MFRSTLLVFLFLILAALLATVGYAWFGLSTPATVLDEAAAELAQGRVRQAIATLDLTERSLGSSSQPQLRHRLLQLRVEARQRLGDPGSLQLALLDLEQLLAQVEKPGDDLLLLRVRLLATTDQGEAALQRGKEFLLAHPGDGRALELCGDACRVLYRDELRELAAQVRSDLVGAPPAISRGALLAFLYRPEGDPGAEDGLRQLAAAYQAESQLQPLWLQLEPRLMALRAQVQRGLDYYRESLEKAGLPVSAFRVFAFALDQSGREDDLLAQSLIYLRRYQHAYTAEAAAMAAESLLRDDLPLAAVAVADLYLPPGALPSRLEDALLGNGVAPLLLTKALALWRLGDRKGLGRLQSECWQLWNEKLDVLAAAQCCNAFVALLDHKDDVARKELAYVCSSLCKQPPPAEDDDPLQLLTELRLGVLARLGAPAAESLAAIDQWQQAPGRSRDLAPRVARARLHLAAGRANAAVTAVSEAMQLAPRDETLLNLQAEASAAAGAATGQDGPGLLQQCLRRRLSLPTVTEPVGYLLCAEAALHAATAPGATPALQKGAAAVAMSCAQKAVELFPLARRPRLLLARTALQLERPDLATAELDQLAARSDVDAEVQRLRVEARAAAGLDTLAVLGEAMRHGADGPVVRTELLRAALFAADPANLERLCRGSGEAATNPRLLVALAAAEARLGHGAAAARALAQARSSWPTDAEPTLAREWSAAAAAVLAAELPASDDEATREHLLSQWLPDALGGGETVAALWLRTARDQDAKGQLLPAWLLASSALEQPGAEAVRNGDNYLFAAGLALRLHRLPQALRYFTAALSFVDGSAAAAPLARLWLLQDRDDKARSVMALDPAPTDGALLLLCDRQDQVLPLLRDDLARDRGDLLAHCTMALCSQVAPGSLCADLATLRGEDRERLLRLLSILHQPELVADAAPLLAPLSMLLPDSVALQLLAARVQLAGGDADGASKAHLRLCERGVTDPLLFSEAVRAAADLAYRMAPPLVSGIGKAAAVPDAPLSLWVFMTRMAAVVAHQSGHSAIGLQMLATLWLSNPEISRASAADANLLFRGNQPAQAVTLITQLLAASAPQLRASLLAQLFQFYELMTDAHLRNVGRNQALGMLQARPLCVPALHYLLQDQLSRVVDNDKLLLSAGRARTLLQEQVTDAASNDGEVLRGLQLLLQVAGDAAAADAAEQVLRQRPWAVDVWVLHAQCIGRAQRHRDAVAELRGVGAFFADPKLQIATIALAADYRLLRDGDQAALQSLPKALRQSGLGHRAAGLVALRLGDGGLAAAELQGAPASTDGSRLYYQALAELLRTDAGSLDRARELFAQLAADYANSSLARYAGSFARQLAPR